MRSSTLLLTLSILGILISLSGYISTTKESNNVVVQKKIYPSDVTPFFNHWNLILGDGSNVGYANNFEHKDFIYTTNDGERNWVVYKAPNSGVTHGTSQDTRTELAQSKKWPPSSHAKLTATLKVMNVSTSGDARVRSSYAVIIGQIHSADGHENEPLKIYYKKFPDHDKGSVFWNYEINTKGDDNSGRWDYSSAVWGYDFSLVGTQKEPQDGIALGEAFSYEIEVNKGIMKMKFTSKGHKTKTFTKNLIASEYTTIADIPKQTRKRGVERKNAYADEFLFFKQGSYNQSSGRKTRSDTYDGDLTKQYANGSYTEVWFKKAYIYVSDDAVSNEGYFIKND